VPRETSRSRTQVVVGSLALLGVFTVGLVGQQVPIWWLPLVAAPLAAATTLGVGQWRVAEMRRATSASTTGEFRNE
jgi:hypothetical protein